MSAEVQVRVRVQWLAYVSSCLALLACGNTLDVGWNNPTINQPGTSVPDNSAPQDLPPASTDPTEDLDAATPLADAGVETPDASADAGLGGDLPPLPVALSSPLIISNDGALDNWQGEHAMLAALEGRPIAGLIVNDSWAWPELDVNLSDWQELVDAARVAGIEGLPDPLRSEAPRLARPMTGAIEDTSPNHSAGAQLIVDTVASLEPTAPPVVVVTGGRLTDVADAYLLDPSIADRLLVVSSLGELSNDGARMTIPNGEMDSWADEIVVERLRYVQVSAYYEQTEDISSEALLELSMSTLGPWLTQKQPQLSAELVACDQVALLAATTPGFIVSATRAVPRPRAPFDALEGPNLVSGDVGELWLITAIDETLGAERLAELISRVP